LIFSWLLCTPFYILHVDLWAPGNIANYRGEIYLINSMCDLTGFVLVTATNDITTHNLSCLFVQEVLLKVGFCGLVVIDDGSTFKGLFCGVCQLLNIKHHVAARGNHKAVGVEKFHRFLNKAVAIAANDRGTVAVFVKSAHTAAYAWNSSPIGGTNIIHSVLLSTALSDSPSTSALPHHRYLPPIKPPTSMLFCDLAPLPLSSLNKSSVCSPRTAELPIVPASTTTQTRSSMRSVT
jgi:hypothetical protein